MFRTDAVPGPAAGYGCRSTKTTAAATTTTTTAATTATTTTTANM